MVGKVVICEASVLKKSTPLPPYEIHRDDLTDADFLRQRKADGYASLWVDQDGWMALVSKEQLPSWMGNQDIDFLIFEAPKRKIQWRVR